MLEVLIYSFSPEAVPTINHLLHGYLPRIAHLRTLCYYSENRFRYPHMKLRGSRLRSQSLGGVPIATFVPRSYDPAGLSSSSSTLFLGSLAICLSQSY